MMIRHTRFIAYIATYLLAAGTAVRYLTNFQDDRFWPLAGLLAGYLLMLGLEPFVIRQMRALTYIYLAVQIAIICALSLLAPNVDFWGLLFFPLIVQVMHNFPQRAGFLFTGIFTVIMAALMLAGVGPEQGLALIAILSVIYILLAAMIVIIREATEAREESQRQKADLEAAYQQLKSYTSQAEELAILQERNRLARNLHDSVTQSLYSLTLLAEAGQRMLRGNNLRQADENQRRIAEISQQALQELRLLVYELRPRALENERLCGALEHRLEAVERRAGINARLFASGEIDLPQRVEEELFRIAMEALNNALKHTKASEVTIRVSASEYDVALEVKDNGGGFDQTLATAKGGLGLSSMTERVEGLGGKLKILSDLGVGTTVVASVPLPAKSGFATDSAVATGPREATG